jgi:hypothetical protein
MTKLTFLGSYMFTKWVVGPPQPHSLRRDDEGEPPGGNQVGRLVSVAFGPQWRWGIVIVLKCTLLVPCTTLVPLSFSIHSVPEIGKTKEKL